MLTKRIIPCLDVDDGFVVKGKKFQGVEAVGDPVEMAKFYTTANADELVFLDIGASYKSRDTLKKIVKRVSAEIYIPFTVGGGIRTVDDMREMLCLGADKISVCSAAVKNPRIIREGADIFGSQCIVVSIDAKRSDGNWTIYVNGGRIDTGIDALKWAIHVEKLGAGEILLNSIDNDGMNKGYDLELTNLIAENVGIPVIASGGAGTLEDILRGARSKADALLFASILHYNTLTIKEIKDYLKMNGVEIR